MSPPPRSGRLTREALAEQISRGDLATVLTVFPDLYGRLVGKRISGNFFVDSVADHGMYVCDYLLACDMEMDPVPGYRLTGWDTGYGDFHVRPDFATLRAAAWLPGTALVLCDLFDAHGVAVEPAPRRMLQRQLAQAQSMGFSVKGGSELEFYLFDESYESARRKHYHDLQTAGAYIEDYHALQSTRVEPVVGAIRTALEQSGVPVEFSKGEWGPGQQEINLRYCEALEQCDRNVIYKQAAKEVAMAHGKAVTFMSKWDHRHAGNSMHIHLSLWDPEGRSSRFAGEHTLGPVTASDEFRWFLGGWIAHAHELAVCYAPYPVSYKRYQTGSFAPTMLAWSYDNRTAGFRVVGHGPSLRIECRIPGADANPYVAYAAAIASGLDGIANRLEPPAAFTGDAYRVFDLARVPSTLREAIEAFAVSEFARIALGDTTFEHYLHFVRTEQRKFDEVVTCWERDRYFERG